MKTPTELDIIKAYRYLSIIYSELYLLVKLEDIFYEYPHFTEYNSCSFFYFSGEFKVNLEEDINQSIIDDFHNTYTSYTRICGEDHLLYLFSLVNRENILECKNKARLNIEQSKEILKGF